MLCVECHDRAETRGGVGRVLSPALIRTYRADWLLRVAERRRRASEEPGVVADALRRTPSAITPSDTVDALGVLEVRQLGYAAEDAVPDWEAVATTIHNLARYARDFGHATKVEVLRVASALAGDARQGMPPRVAWMLHAAATEAMPLVMFRRPVTWAIEGPEHLRIALATEVGRGLAYDGARYLKSIGVVKAGAAIMAHALAMTRSVSPAEIRAEVDEAFEERISAAKEHGESDFARWLEFERAEARVPGSGDYESVKDLMRGSSD